LTDWSLLVLALGAFCAGGFIAWLVAHRLHSQHLFLLEQRHQEQEKDARQREDALQQQLRQGEEQTDSLRLSLQRESGERIRLATRLEDEHKAAVAREQQLKQAQELLKNEFGRLASKLFEEKNRQLAEQNQSLLQPLREQLHQFRARVDQIHTSEVEQQSSLKTELKALRELNQRITEEANNLTKALQGKGSSQKQGAWGELILERLLEQSGLSKGREYEMQRTFADEEGARQRPDAIVHLPDNKDVIIDSKVSLNAYTRYHAAEDDEARQLALNELSHAVRAHIRELSGRDYSHLLAGRSLDLVLMFVPVEGAYVLALGNDPELFEFAFGKRIALIGPSTLPGTLKIINYLWRTDDQNRNARDIARRAGNLYDKVSGLVGDLDKLGKHLERSQSTLTEAKGKLYSGRGNLVGRVEEFRRLGVSVKKPIDKAEATLEVGQETETESEKTEEGKASEQSPAVVE